MQIDDLVHRACELSVRSGKPVVLLDRKELEAMRRRYIGLLLGEEGATPEALSEAMIALDVNPDQIEKDRRLLAKLREGYVVWISREEQLRRERIEAVSALLELRKRHEDEWLAAQRCKAVAESHMKLCSQAKEELERLALERRWIFQILMEHFKRLPTPPSDLAV